MPINLRQRYQARHAELLQAIASTSATTRSVQRTLMQLSKLAEETLQALWRQAHVDATLALVAVGGFGRAELFPYSDVDVLVLLPDELALAAQPKLQAAVEAFISSCWDAGLAVGASVRSIQDCLREADNDVSVQTALLESRCIAGSSDLFARFYQQFEATLDARAFFVAKTLELHQRHTKFENTPYALEPNCKESPGGLRDLQMILWVSKAARLGNNWDELAQNNLATALEVRQIKRNQALLSLIRARLHGIAKRREDRLVFDLQNAVAQSFLHPKTNEPAHASTALMQRYYWTAKAVTQLNQILLLNIEERLSPSGRSLRPINARFFDKAGLLEVASDDLYQREPNAILETFWLCQTTAGINGLSARTLRALYNSCHVMGAAFRRNPANHACFMQMVMHGEGLTRVLQLMNQTSVLGRYLWVFHKIVGQMQHDLFHVYTVDQHILMVLRNVRRFFIAEHAHEYPFCSQLASTWEHPWLLYLAALFHDIAKGRGGDHSTLGALEVKRFCRQHGINQADTELLEFLVREHLTMSQVAQKSDLSERDVVAAFAKRIGNERRLNALYLLTVADIRGTSPKVWNAWKAKLLEDLYHLSLRALGGHQNDLHNDISERKHDALVLLAHHALPFDAHKNLWDTLDAGYFMRHDANDIAWHTRQLSRHVNSSKPIVRARLSPLGEGLQVLVYTPDQNDLFARICGYFDHSSLSIADARIHTTRNGHALDSFQVIADTLPEHDRERISLVENELEHAITQTGALPEPRQGRLSRRVKNFPMNPRVTLSPDEKAQRWLLNISASDRIGLLYRIARVLAQHGIQLQLAKISTLGERVDDTFLIQGTQLQDNRTQIAIETELLAVLSNSTN
jgi:[protein-PII] uridylyltransferase